MNEETKILQYKLDKDYLTIDDVIRYGGIGKIYLVIGKDPTVKYWLCKNKDGNVLVPADKEPYYSEISHRLLIIGNGFDLHCGANSTYNAFFDEQFGITLAYDIEALYSKGKLSADDKKKIDQKFMSNAKHLFHTYYYGFKCRDIKKIFQDSEIIFLTKYKIKLLNKIQIGTSAQASSILNQLDEKIRWCRSLVSKWDIIFYLAKLCSNQIQTNWSDIEKMIFNVISIILNKSNIYMGPKFNALIKSLFPVKDKNQKSDELLDELKIFEKEFAKFIQKQETLQYYKNAKATIEQLENVDDNRITLDVFNFNYSLNYNALSFFNLNSKILIHSWTNIHGIADYDKKFNSNSPAPIFGVDLHELLKNLNGNIYDDLRLKFTKSYRLSINHVNNIRENNFQNKVDIITIVGHSLSPADYSYFESIFDKYNLYDGTVELECYYAQGIDTEEDYTELVDALLTDYGNTLKNIHGENIFNKLMLERRLRILPY